MEESDGVERDLLGIPWIDRTLARSAAAVVVALTLAFLGNRLGESRTLWYYLLCIPLVILCVTGGLASLQERKADRRERDRVRAIARVKGRSRHARRGR